MNEATPAGPAPPSPPSSNPEAEPGVAESAPRLPFLVVGLGASAGGLEAFIEFFRNLPAETGMAFVLVQHLPAEKESKLCEILKGRTPMPVVEIEDNMPLLPNRVHVIRPGCNLTLSGGRLHLTYLPGPTGDPVVIDHFFRSLAEEQRVRGIAIVMSGLGADGTAGARAIKATGGICIAQDPVSAKFPSMPEHLIASGAADFVLSPLAMPAQLARYSSHPYLQDAEHLAIQGEEDHSTFAGILSLLHEQGAMDFSGYKKAMLLRRIARRMSLGSVHTLDAYFHFLRQSAGEIAALADDMLIHVTSFFRDPEAWEEFRRKVIFPLVRNKPDRAAIRGWVTGCSTGEEAYTLAILLAETAAEWRKEFDIVIFATDAAGRSIAQARAGVYPAEIESALSAARLERNFDREASSYRIKKKLRELVVFAEHNLLRDPPYSRLDICTCRNVLIYLQPAVQRRVMTMFHFGLVENGALLLGRSETIAGSDELFLTVDKRQRIFRRIGAPRPKAVDFDFPQPSRSVRENLAAGSGAGGRHGIVQLTQKILSERFGPPSVVIDRDQRIVYFQGKTERFLDPPRGEPTHQILSLIREPFRGAVGNLIQQAFERNAEVTFRNGLVDADGAPIRVEIRVAPLDAKSIPSFFLISFLLRPEPVAPPAAPPEGATGHPEVVQHELARVREDLKHILNEAQEDKEEMRASNEEIVSMNEELQSTNEELETSKEELQSLNEELTTVNSQLQVKLEELEISNDDLGSLLASTSIGVIFLDRHLLIRRFTPAVKDLLDLIPTDLGRPLSDLAPKFRDDGLLPDIRSTLEDSQPRENEVHSQSGRIYLRRALPYRTNDSRNDGVVVTFIEITAQKHSEVALRISEERHRLIVHGVRDYAIFMLDPSGRIITWSPSAELLLGYNEADAMGRTLEILTTPEDCAAELVQAEISAAIRQGSTHEDRWYLRRDGTRFWGAGTLSALRAPDGTLRGFAQILRDTTEKKITEDAIQIAKRAAELSNEAKDEFLANVSHELRTPLSAMLLWTRMLEEENYSDPAQVKAGMDVIRACALEQQGLIEDLVDLSRIASGKLRLDLQPVDLTLAVQNSLNSARLAAAEKGVTMREEIEPGVGFANADQRRLQQILSNLLSNAVKFTPKGGTISFALRRKGDEVEMEVSDTGIGISPEFLPHIFERFRQAARPTTRLGSGLGLGLSITKQLVELYGGVIQAQSQGLGQGAQMTVRLPLPTLRPTTLPAAVSTLPAKGERCLQGRRLLLIEDSNSAREALATLLRKAGAEVVDFANSAAAIIEYQRQPPDCIVSDLGLPKIDGHDLIRFFRAWETTHRLPRIPAIAVTAYADEKNRRKALECGFDQVLTKPLDLEQLLRVLASLTPARKTPPKG